MTRTLGSEISLDSALAPELVEFWGFKYKETKEELEKLKVSHCLLPSYLLY